MKFIGIWYWVKITDNGDLVLPLDSIHRKPYEPLIIGMISSSMRVLPSTKIFVSVPGKHSRKPPVGPMFQEYLPENPCCLELFARNLTAGNT